MTFRVPYPLIGGDRIKSYYLLKHLAENHNVFLLSFFFGNGDYSEYQKHLEDLGLNVKIFRINTIPKVLSKLHKIPFNKPLEILWFEDNAFQKEVDRIIEEENIDIGFSFFMRTAEYIKSKEIPKVLIAEDCRTTYQYRSYKASKKFHQRFIRWWEYNKLRKYEPSVIDKFDYTTLVSDADIGYMKELNPKANLKLLTNGTDIEKYKPNGEGRSYLLLTGRLDLWANQLMISKILDKFLPTIKTKHPEVKFKIVGARPPEWIRNLNDSAIEKHFDVPSMVEYYQDAAVFLHPHYGATGIQNKLLEAMSTCCPVVTTHTGNQGIKGEHGKHIMLAENDEQFLEYVLKLYEDKKFAKEIGENARQLIIDTHSWQVVYSQLDSIIEEVSK